MLLDLISHHDLPVHLPPDFVLFSPSPAKLGVKRRPILPFRMNVQAFELFHVLRVPDAWLSRNLVHCQYSAPQRLVRGLARTASIS